MSRKKGNSFNLVDPPAQFRRVWNGENIPVLSAQVPKYRAPGNRPDPKEGGKEEEEEDSELMRWRFDYFIERVVSLLVAWGNASPANKPAALDAYRDFVREQPDGSGGFLGVFDLVIEPNLVNGILESVLVAGVVVDIDGALQPGGYSSSSSSSVRP